MDANDHQGLADWWCRAIGYVRGDSTLPSGEQRPDDWPVRIVDPNGVGPLIWVVPVPEAKTVKNRMHIDVFGDVGELVALGATLVTPRADGRNWDVLVDPEGNEFCVFTPRE